MKTQRGQIWKLGDHRLAVVDSVNTDMTLLFGDEKVRMIATEPPYGTPAQKDDEKDQKIHGGFEEYADFTTRWLERVSDHMAEINSVYIFNAELMYCALRDGMANAGYYYSQALIWVKAGGSPGRKDYIPQHEMIAYGWKGQHQFERSKMAALIYHPVVKKSKLHPSMKPVGLMRTRRAERIEYETSHRTVWETKRERRRAVLQIPVLCDLQLDTGQVACRVRISKCGRDRGSHHGTNDETHHYGREKGVSDHGMREV